MDKINILEAIFIGTAVATFLLNTKRVLKAIECCKECLILLNSKALKKHEAFVQSTYKIVHLIMLKGYNLINDRRREGERAFRLAEMYQLRGKYQEANKMYMKSLSIMIETGERVGEANCYVNLGTLFRSLGDYGKAKEYIEKALLIFKEIGHKNGDAICYESLGTMFRSLGDFGKAKEYLEKALLIFKEIGDKNGEATCYGNLGNVLLCLGECDKAEEYVKKSLVHLKELGNRIDEAACYGNLGCVFLTLGKYEKAEEYLKKSLVHFKELGNRKEEAACYVNLGVVFQPLGDFGKAKEYLEKGLLISKEIGDKNGEAKCYENLGDVLLCLGECDKAEEYLKKSLVHIKEIGDRRREAACYQSLSSMCRSPGKYSEVEEYQKKALVIFQEIGDRKKVVECYGTLGERFVSVGEYGKAEEQYREALVIAKKIGDREQEAACYGQLGTIFQYRGEYVKAEEYQKKALAISENIGNKKIAAGCYINLGNVFTSLGKYGEADDYYNYALVIINEIGDKKAEAQCYVSQSHLFHCLGEYGKAKEYQEKALEIRKKIGDRVGEADCYGDLGTVFQSLAEYGKAEEYQKRALAIQEEIGHRRGQARCYGNLGTVMIYLKEYGKAKEYLDKALKIREKIGDREGEALCYGNLGRVFSILGEKAEEYYKKALSLSEETGDMLTQLHCHLWLALDGLRHGVMPVQGDEVFSNLLANIHKCEKMRSFFRKKDQFKISFLDRHVLPYQLLSALFCCCDHYNEAVCVQELGRARALSDLMSTQYNMKQEISDNPQSWVGIEGILNKEVNCTFLYISYIEDFIYILVLKANKPILYRYINVNECFVGKRLQRNVDEIFSDETVRNFQVLPQDRCEDRSLSALYAVYRQPKSSQEEYIADLRLIEQEEDESEDQRSPPTLAECYKMIIVPVADLLEEPEIIIVPDRSFYKIPFAALSDANEKYLSETYKIRIVPSLSTLKLIQERPADYHSQAGALIVGDPYVGTVVYKGNIEKISSLPCARREAEMIGRLLRVQPLVGKQATKQAVLQSIHSVSLIHFAAHGDAERGEIALAPVESIDVHPQEEDYLLTMSDISQVQLRAKLVVLSCCHSAQGAIKAEGVVGIARAFLGSGARSVLVALWAISDEATEQLMSHFYEHLVRGESASESLHEAIKWMRSNGYSDVREWAPFMLIGDNVTFEFSK